MKKYLLALGLLMGAISMSYAGTPQETFYVGQAPLSGASIFTSTASASSNGNFTLTVATPTAINSGGSTYTGRNCFTRFVVQIPTTTVVTIADGDTTKWTIYGSALGTTGSNTLSLPEDHLGPLCTSANSKTLFTLTNTSGNPANPSVINVEGYTTYGGTNNQGVMN